VTRVALATIVTMLATACSLLQPMAPGGPATWTFAPEQAIGPQTTEFVAMVTERACASGQSSEGRIIGPQIEHFVDEKTLTITFQVRSLDGAQECPGNPPTPVRVVLGEPLGNRRLLDGGREPPSEPPVCANPDSCE
jgi:hypothetical protein